MNNECISLRTKATVNILPGEFHLNRQTEIHSVLVSTSRLSDKLFNVQNLGSTKMAQSGQTVIGQCCI